MSFSLTGDLTKDALGLWQHLETRRAAPELARYQDLYCILHRGGWVEERNTSRSPGASYNPRPARLVRLLVEAAPEAPSLGIEAAFILGAYGLPQDRVPMELGAWTEAFTLAGHALDMPNGTNGRVSPPLTGTLAAIRLLDHVRHLHQRGLSPSELRENTLLAHGQSLALSNFEGNSLLIERIQATCEKLLHRRDCLQP